MARPERLLSNLPAVCFDVNIVLVATRGEEKRMPEAIGCLRGILADEVCRGVAAIASRHYAVRRLAPAIELFAHDVAVGAGRWIVSEVRPALGIREGIDANSNGNANNDAKQDALYRAKFHRCFRLTAFALRAAQRRLPHSLREATAGN